MLEFKQKENNPIALCDLLKVMRLCSNGAEAKHVISEGLVKVDGQVELRKRAKILPGQVVEYKGQQIKVS